MSIVNTFKMNRISKFSRKAKKAAKAQAEPFYVEPEDMGYGGFDLTDPMRAPKDAEYYVVGESEWASIVDGELFCGECDSTDPLPRYRICQSCYHKTVGYVDCNGNINKL